MFAIFAGRSRGTPESCFLQLAQTALEGFRSRKCVTTLLPGVRTNIFLNLPDFSLPLGIVFSSKDNIVRINSILDKVALLSIHLGYKNVFRKLFYKGYCLK
jgi:hypothetical protein